MQTAIHYQCKFAFSGPKLAVIASKPGLGKRLSQRLGDDSTTNRGHSYQAKVLGMDQRAGKKTKYKTKKGMTTHGKGTVGVLLFI